MRFRIEREPWMVEAKCREVEDPSIFFPNPGDSVKAAQAICASCVVIEDCRAYILSLPHDTIGIYAGTTHRERRLLFREESLHDEYVLTAIENEGF